MREINKISEALFEKIRDRFEDVSLGDENAQATQDPQKARFFNFDYADEGYEHGNITISLIDENSLKIYFSKNISNDLDEESKKKWYNFLRELREFSRRNLLNFEPRDITRSSLQIRDLKQQSKADSTYGKDEVVNEGKMYGSKKRSYESFGPVKIKVQHSQTVDEEVHGSRSRNISALFIENDQSERFKLPFNSLAGARAMARHVSAGGIPTDEFGLHITEMVEELKTLRPFVMSMRTRTFEDETTQSMLESTFGYHKLLKDTLHKLKGKRGYNEYKESYSPAETTAEDVDIDSLKDRFVRKTFDDRLESSLSLVEKAHKIMKEKKCKYSEDFESWATRISEGTWQVPETDEDIKELAELLRDPIPCGVDGMNAINALGGLIGDDSLYDDIEALAKVDPEADCNSLIVFWLENWDPELLEKIKDMSPDGFVRDQHMDEDKEYECPTCRGAGEYRDEEHKKHDCPDCDGEGKYVDVDDLEEDNEKNYRQPGFNNPRKYTDDLGIMGKKDKMKEGKMKDLAMDLNDLSDKEFEEKYGMKKTDWDEVKTPGLRQDPSKPAYISKNLKDKKPKDWAQAISADESVVYEAHEKLEKLVGQRVYVKDKGQTGTVAQVSNTHSNALVVDMDNGQTTVTHFTDLTSEDDKPTAVKRYLDMLKAIFDLHGKGPTPKDGLPAKSWDTLGEEELSDIKRLSGLK